MCALERADEFAFFADEQLLYSSKIYIKYNISEYTAMRLPADRRNSRPSNAHPDELLTTMKLSRVCVP